VLPWGSAFQRDEIGAQQGDGRIAAAGAVPVANERDRIAGDVVAAGALAPQVAAVGVLGIRRVARLAAGFLARVSARAAEVGGRAPARAPVGGAGLDGVGAGHAVSAAAERNDVLVPAKSRRVLIYDEGLPLRAAVARRGHALLSHLGADGAR